MTLAHLLTGTPTAADLKFHIDMERVDPQLSPEELARLKLARLEALKREGKR